MNAEGRHASSRGAAPRASHASTRGCSQRVTLRPREAHRNLSNGAEAHYRPKREQANSTRQDLPGSQTCRPLLGEHSHHETRKRSRKYSHQAPRRCAPDDLWDVIRSSGLVGGDVRGRHVSGEEGESLPLPCRLDSGERHGGVSLLADRPRGRDGNRPIRVRLARRHGRDMIPEALPPCPSGWLPRPGPHGRPAWAAGGKEVGMPCRSETRQRTVG